MMSSPPDFYIPENSHFNRSSFRGAAQTNTPLCSYSWILSRFDVGECLVKIFMQAFDYLQRYFEKLLEK